MPIRDEEYTILAFAMESVVSELLSAHPKLGPPKVYLIDSEPDLGAGREDLVHWWHQAVAKFLHLQNHARIDLLKAEEEKGRFDRRKFSELGLEIATMDHHNLPRAEQWQFSLSRAVFDRASRQALAHVWTEPECSAQYGAGFILVMSWDEPDGTLHVLERVVTGKLE